MGVLILRLRLRAPPLSQNNLFLPDARRGTPLHQMALQNPADLRFALRRRDPQSADTDDTTSTSSWANLGEQGLVSLHRAKYSPRPSASGWRA